jgi:Family of unknown function (DUF6049)
VTAPTPGTGTGARGAGPCVGRALAVLGVAGTLVLPVVPAATAPALASPPTASTGTATDQPVHISITRLEPRTITPDAVVTVTGTLSNTGDQTVTHLQLRLQRGRVLTSRAELVAQDSDPDPDTAVVAPFTDLPEQLEPGESAGFTYTLPAAQLRLGQDGVYPVLLNANGTVAGGERRVGELATYLVAPPATGAGRTAVAWLWPLVDRTHRDASGRFTDDDLAREVGSNGRLERALSVLEQLPRVPGPAGGTVPAVPAVPVTLAIDPELVEELRIMAAGPYQVGTSAGSGTQAAAAFLQRLRAVAAEQAVVALPYGDVDADALLQAGLGGVLTRSLPGTAAGTAHDDRVAGTATSAAPSSPPPSGEDTGRGTGAGAQLLADVLGVRPRTDLGWLPRGPVAAGVLTTYRDGGTDRVVVSSDALAQGGAALGLGRTPAAARTTVTAGTAPLDALVGDTELGGLADEGGTTGGPRVGEQRYLAELALLSMATPASGTATVLVTPPREVDVHVPDATQMLVDATQQPWLQPVPLDAVVSGPSVATGAPVAATGSTLDATGMAAVAAAVTARDDLAGAAVGDPAGALAPYDAAIARSTSLAWRDDPGRFRAAVHDLTQVVGRLRDRVALVVPSDGTYSLASNDAPLVLTVRNDLPFAVQVLLRLGARGAGGLDLGDLGQQTLAPGSRTTLQVPTQVRRSGGFTVVATLTTPDGRPLGDPVQIKVKSTAYGSVSLIITVGAAVLLGLLFLRRLVRWALRRRRGGPDDGLPGPSAEGAAVPLPPTRSPV